MNVLVDGMFDSLDVVAWVGVDLSGTWHQPTGRGLKPALASAMAGSKVEACGVLVFMNSQAEELLGYG